MRALLFSLLFLAGALWLTTGVVWPEQTLATNVGETRDTRRWQDIKSDAQTSGGQARDPLRVVDPVLGEALAYVRANRARAEAGDARAQYRIGLIAQRCAAVYANYLTDGDLDLEGREWTACGSFQTDTLDGIDGPAWIEQALAANDPLAVLETANIRFMTGQGSREELDRAIALVEQSGDAEALTMLARIQP